jgi:hypothetical protein
MYSAVRLGGSPVRNGFAAAIGALGSNVSRAGTVRYAGRRFADSGDMTRRWIRFGTGLLLFVGAAVTTLLGRTAKSDAQAAGRSTKHAVKHAGHATARTARTASHKVKRGTKKVVHKAAGKTTT